MIDALIRLDTSAFRFFNKAIANPLFDILMPFVTDLNRNKLVLVVVLLLLLWMIFRGSKPVRLSALLLIVTIICSDQLSSSFIKYLVARPRPCHVLFDVRLLVGCGSGFSFPSSHAVNNFAGAIVLAYFMPRGAPWLFAFATLVAFSRIYVGVHYPADVLGGAVIGLLIGGCIIGLFSFGESKYLQMVQRRISHRSGTVSRRSRK